MKYWEKPFGKEKPDILGGEIRIIADECTACKLCEAICPDFAIFILEKEGTLDKKE